jgi:hypothetical protein
MAVSKKGKFKTAYHRSSLFKEIDVDLLYREQKSIWDNVRFEYYRLYSPGPNFSGEYMSTDEYGFRKTVQFMKNEQGLPVKDIAIFGSSTMWGGASGGDEYTVASFLSKFLNETDKKLNFHVKNFSVGAYTSTQELILFIELLENEAFDIAVFVDGPSEFQRSYSEMISSEQNNFFLKPALHYMHRGLINNGELPDYITLPLKLKESLWGTLFVKVVKMTLDVFRRKTSRKNNHHSEFYCSENIIDKQIKRTVNLYKKNRRIIEAIAKNYGMKVFFVLEPFLFTKDKLSQEEKSNMKRYESNVPFVKFTRKCIAAFQHEFSLLDNCFDFTGIFSGNSTIFLDDHHTSQKGNMIIAKELSENIHQYLRSEHT